MEKKTLKCFFAILKKYVKLHFGVIRCLISLKGHITFEESDLFLSWKLNLKVSYFWKTFNVFLETLKQMRIKSDEKWFYLNRMIWSNCNDEAFLFAQFIACMYSV